MNSAEEAQAVVYRRQNGRIGTLNQRLDLVLDLLVERVRTDIVNNTQDELSFGFFAYTTLTQHKTFDQLSDMADLVSMAMAPTSIE